MASLLPRAVLPIPIRLARLARLLIHLLRGLAICAIRFPRESPAQHRREITRWSRRLLQILHVRVRCVDEPERWPARSMIVANHISWIDVVAVLSVAPCVFVAKSEIRAWPVIGWLVAAVGTLFIERDKKSHVRATNERIVAAIESGQTIAVCPEGTTTYGDSLLAFRPALFQPAIMAQATLQPVALRYLDRTDTPTRAAAYVGEMSLLDSVWRVVSEPRMTLELAFAEPIAAGSSDRRELARVAERAIARCLGVPAPHMKPETPRDRAVVAR